MSPSRRAGKLRTRCSSFVGQTPVVTSTRKPWLGQATTHPLTLPRPSDALFRDQAGEMDRNRREALLHRIQQLMHERAMFGPIIEQAGLIGVGPRLAEVPTITGHPFISPYEDLKLK